MTVADLPEHEFISALQNDDGTDPDAICMATLETATVDNDGYGFITQCGHTRLEHGLPSPKDEGV
jgi:hypothetical protein